MTRLGMIVGVVAAAVMGIAALAAGSRVWQAEAEPGGPLAEHAAAKMVGMWRGTVSSMGRDGRWHEAEAVERARWNLAGTAILVEGYGYADDPETGERVVGHDAFGLIEHDAASGRVRFHARRAGSGFTAHTLETVPETGAMRWSPEAQGADVRFTITVTDARWHEVGEMSRDGGETWSRFLEMDLKRVGD